MILDIRMENNKIISATYSYVQYMYIGLEISNIDTVNSRMEELDTKYWIFIYKFNIQFNIEFNTIIQYLRGFS